MKIATILALATVALAKHHHRHDRNQAIVKDIDIDDNNIIDDIDNSDDLYVSQNPNPWIWNIAGTERIVKEFEGLSLTAY